MSERCKVCAANASFFGEATVLRRHSVRYYRCDRCGFMQTEEPFWLAEAYDQALSGLDVGAVSRNLRLAPLVHRLIDQCFDPRGPFVDYGGGTGLFVRLMRDRGFSFQWMDKFAQNVFARGFEAKAGSFELLTAFEVFEHLVQPVPELERMLEYSKSVLFTTVLLPEPAPSLGTWWYYGLEHGQHVAFHTLRSLQALADRFQLNFCSTDDLHLFTNKPLGAARFRSAIRSRIGRWLRRPSRRPSLTDSDYQHLAAGREPRPVQPKSTSGLVHP